jgi:drug/metabolite transporter superfamily protein YnfA
MDNAASILLLAFLALTFILSCYDKIFYWKDNLAFLKDHFIKTRLKNLVALALMHLLIVELFAGILCVVGIIELWTTNGRTYGLYGAIFSCIALLMMLFGQRLAKDYDGARTIVIYYIPAVMAVLLLS